MTHVLLFDKNNNQIEYMHMARSIETKKLVTGYIAIEKPWYEPESHWKYYILSNNYGEGGFSGGATNLGFKKTLVDKDTIEIYNQVANVKLNQEANIITKLIERDCFGCEVTIATISADDKIPYELWK